MAIRTITIIHECYVALQGYWRWNDFFSLRVPRADTILKDLPALIAPPRYPGLAAGATSVTHTSEVDLSDNSGVSVSDSASDGTADDLDSSVDSSLDSLEVDLPLPLYSGQVYCGLGISGLLAKDGSGPFTGLGVITVHPFLPRHTSISAGSQTAAEEIILWATVQTSFNSEFCQNTGDFLITEELGSVLVSKNDPVSLDTSRPLAESLLTCPPPTPTPATRIHKRPARNFAAPTISSELKRITKKSSTTAFPSRYQSDRVSSSDTLVVVRSSSFHSHQTQKGHGAPVLQPFLAGTATAYIHPKTLVINASESAGFSAPALTVKTPARWR